MTTRRDLYISPVSLIGHAHGAPEEIVVIGGGPVDPPVVTIDEDFHRGAGPGYFGAEYVTSYTYWSYLNQYYTAGIPLIQSFILRIISTAPLAAGHVSWFRIVTSDNQVKCPETSVIITGQFQTFELLLNSYDPAVVTDLMIEYKSSIPFFVKEILIVQ